MNSLGKISAITISLLIIVGHLSPAFATKHRRYHSASTSQHVIYGTQNLADELSRIIDSADSKAAIGVQVKSMKQGDILYTHRESDLLSPASTLKVLTAEAALIYLGPDYKFQTALLTNATSTTNGVINGDVYLVHSGDPSLTYEDLTDLMVALKSQQIQTINGNVYVDNSAYDQDNLGPGWLSKDKGYCY